MSQNDVIALNANFDRWCETRGAGLEKQFLYYCVENFVKPFDPPDEDINEGIVDRPGDGGVDALYFLADRELVRDGIKFRKKVHRVNLLILQVKGDEGYSPSKIDKLAYFTDDLLDLTRTPDRYHSVYHSELLDLIRIFKEKYQLIAGDFPAVEIDYFYIVKKDEASPNTDAERSAAAVEQVALKHFNRAVVKFHFINVQILSEQVQKRPLTSKKLQWSAQPIQTAQGYLGLVALKDYFAFIQDDHGGLSRRIFESNVRGFQGDRPVNLAIERTLKSERHTPDFWLLNNGITVIASEAHSAGVHALMVKDPQIVNGLQTSREVYDYFAEPPEGTTTAQLLENEQRQILVRLIEQTDPAMRDAIIRATNSQNKMDNASLRATDEIHRQIEELFPRAADLFYDRRKGFYKDEGKPVAKIVSMTEVLQAVVAGLLQRPNDARARPGDYISDDDKYAEVFEKDRYPLPIYVTLTRLLRKIEQYVKNSDLNIDSQHQRNIKHYMMADVLCTLVETAEPTADLVVERIDVANIPEATLKSSYRRIGKLYARYDADDEDLAAKGVDVVKRLRRSLERRYPELH